MNTTQPIPIPVAKDPTLTATPHIVAVLVGGIMGFLSTKVGLPAQYTPIVSVALATGLTTAVHWIMAKIGE